MVRRMRRPLCNCCFGRRGAPTNFHDVCLLLACHPTVGVELAGCPARSPCRPLSSQEAHYSRLSRPLPSHFTTGSSGHRPPQEAAPQQRRDRSPPPTVSSNRSTSLCSVPAAPSLDSTLTLPARMWQACRRGLGASLPPSRMVLP